MTPFWRACIAAYWARRQHGDRSSEYLVALDEMERQRYTVPRRRFCIDCGRPEHRGQACLPDRELEA